MCFGSSCSKAIQCRYSCLGGSSVLDFSGSMRSNPSYKISAVALMRIVSPVLSLVALVLSIPCQLASDTYEYVDLIELNHFCDKCGRLVFEQVIFYERTPTNGKFQVRAWCMVEDHKDLTRRPVKNEQTGLYQVDWYDSDKKLQRKITSRLYRESWTQVDPEVANKKVHPECLRIGLVKRFEAAKE